MRACMCVYVCVGAHACTPKCADACTPEFPHAMEEGVCMRQKTTLQDCFSPSWALWGPRLNSGPPALIGSTHLMTYLAGPSCLLLIPALLASFMSGVTSTELVVLESVAAIFLKVEISIDCILCEGLSDC